ncbi:MULTISPECIES: sensor histidine kinase [Clostridium]|uniref:Histidine kinase n=1 Tax=Clostridium paridis TaxID=2803863 RepID=A0A937FCG3_9CLOT|nr:MULTISPECIES: histidine kinase [Clostridium]MBL4931505.1 histidine kinase [Clostridium paridis]
MRLLNLFKIDSIRKSLLLYSFILILLMLVTSIYTFYNAQSFSNKMNTMYSSNKTLTDLSKDIEAIDTNLLNYLTTKNSDSYDNYVRLSDDLKDKLDTFSRKLTYDKNQIILKDIANITDSYIYEADSAINARRVGNIALYNQKYKDSEKYSEYIKSYINKLNETQFQDNTSTYFNMYDKLNTLKILNIIIIIDTLIINIIILFIFTNNISHPITILSHAAEEISNGNFDINDVPVNVNKEIQIMSFAFNKMKNNIKTYISQLKLQAEIESNLMEEKMNNLKMKNLLKNAEISALQSQINPHFLFNTLNAGVQLAMMENADRTSVFIENLSNLFRYNLSKMDKSVLLKEEVANLNSYIYILKTRFGDLIEFKVEVDENLLDYPIPSMIIQPIFENACVHGVGDMESGGRITLSIIDNLSNINIIVKDNGKGMDKDTVSNILNLKSINKEHNDKTKRHTTGIGLKNVIQRIRLFYDEYDVVDIHSVKGLGTEIILKIPKKRGNEDV